MHNIWPIVPCKSTDQSGVGHNKHNVSTQIVSSMMVKPYTCSTGTVTFAEVMKCRVIKCPYTLEYTDH